MKHFRQKYYLAAILILITRNLVFAENIQPSRESQIVPGVVVAKVKNRLNFLSESGALQKAFSFSNIQPLFPNQLHYSELSKIYQIEFPPQFNPKKIAAELAGTGLFEYAEPKYLSTVLSNIPNDSLMVHQQHLWQTDMLRAWMIQQGSAETVIAIVDNGTEYAHPDLSENIWKNFIEANGLPGIDDDDNGFVDDSLGWDFGENDNDPTYATEESIIAVHGTHTAGIASAVTNNTTGIAGVGWNCKIMAVKISTDDDPFQTPFGYEGIVYAADNGAKIISNSWGRRGDFSQFEQDVINYAANKGCLVVAAGGNTNLETIYYPAGYTHVIAVAAVNEIDKKASYSSFGKYIDISAPGGDRRIGRPGIFSLYTMDQSGYGELSGTSMATPIVSGVLGLLKTEYPNFSQLQLTRQIVLTADDINNQNPEYPGKIGFGRVNGYRALTEPVRIEEPARVVLFRAASNDSVFGNGNFLYERDEIIGVDLWYRNFAVSPGLNFEVFLSSLDTALIMVNNTTTVAVVPPDSVLAIQNQLSFQIKASAEPHLSRLVLNYLLDNGEGGSDTLFAMIGESGVLLVDDDDGGYHNVEKYYTNILDHQQVDYLRWDHHNLGSPPREMITHFPLIIWFCEWAFPSLTPEDRSALEYYLDNGGSLFISGQDIGWDLADPTGIENSQYSESSLHFYENYLRSIYMSDLSLSSRVFGQPGTIGQELVFEIYQPGIPVNFQFPDWIEPGEGASGCFRYENDKGAGVEFKGDSKVLNLGFGFEAMDGSRYDDPARISKVRLEFMRRLLNEYGPISREPIKDREFAPEPVIFQANISPLVKNINQISLFFKTDSMEDYQESLMIDYGNNAYQVEVDFNQYRGDVYYYFSLITPYYQFNSPAGSSENPFVFSIGQDLVPPVILHNSLRDIINQTTNRKAAIYVEDNMKVDTTSVILFYFTGTIKDSVKMVLRNENWYEAFIPPVCAFGDSLVYYFSARDIANPPNHVISEQYTYKVGKEDFEHGTGFWIADSNSWKLDDLECYSPDYSISTFPGQAYQNGQNVSLYLRNGLKRNKLQNCFLGFRTKYWIENNKDFGYIEVSSNGGIDWQNIHPLVTGEQENWILMNCELDSFYSETDDTLLLRFRLQTDSSQSKPMAGWFIDNIEIQQGSPVGITFNGQNFSKIETFKVLPNVPNPFNATTRITYFVETPGIIAIEIFNTLGQRILNREIGIKQSGEYIFQWDGRDSRKNLCSSGIYFSRLRENSLTHSQKTSYSNSIKLIYLR